MKKVLLILSVLLFTASAFAGDSRVYTDADLGKYKSESQAPPGSRYPLDDLKSSKNKTYIPNEISNEKKKSAYDLCTSIIKVWLKTPSVARFTPSMSTPEASLFRKDDYHYYASGTVDSQNSYGAMLRNSFFCIMTMDESGFWDVESHDLY